MWRIFPVEVTATERVTDRLIEITVGDPALAGFVPGGWDQRTKVFLPRPGDAAPILPADHPDGWYQAYLAQPAGERPVLRTYTVHRADPDRAEVALRFVLHGDTGPASAWAGRATPGDRLGLLGPVTAPAGAGGIEFRPPPGTDGHLVAGDESALPAIGAILAGLPAGSPARVLIEVGGPADEIPLPTAADADIRWLHRGGADPGRSDVLLRELRAGDLPGTRPYCWVAGETGAVRDLRRHVRRHRGLPGSALYAGGYWRRGRNHDQL